MAIFFFDAYIGVYDTLYVEEGWEREIAFDRPYPQYIETDYGETVYFRYEITNRGFKEYNTHIQASVWSGNEKKLTLSTAKTGGKEIREVLNPHIIMYGLSSVTGLCAITFFLTMDISKPLKIMASIIMGMVLIFIANWMQKRGKKE